MVSSSVWTKHPLELQSEEFEFDGNAEFSTTTNHSHKQKEGGGGGGGGGGVGEGEDEEDDAAEEEQDGEDDLEEEDDEEQGYRFRFSGDMDPLSFTKQDSSGLQPYEQFEHLEHQYQALTAEKREAHPTIGLPHPPSYHREIPAKKIKAGGCFWCNNGEIMEVVNFGMRRRSRKV